MNARNYKHPRRVYARQSRNFMSDIKRWENASLECLLCAFDKWDYFAKYKSATTLNAEYLRNY